MLHTVGNVHIDTAARLEGVEEYEQLPSLKVVST